MTSASLGVIHSRLSYSYEISFAKFLEGLQSISVLSKLKKKINGKDNGKWPLDTCNLSLPNF
jgi:hypothetical protein